MAGEPNKFKLVITRSFLKDLQKMNRPDQIRIRKALPGTEADRIKGGKSYLQMSGSIDGGLEITESAMIFRVERSSSYE